MTDHESVNELYANAADGDVNKSDWQNTPLEDSTNTNHAAWFSEAKKYEWQEDFGDVGPRDEELEKDLFHNELRLRRGIQFDKLTSINVTSEATERPAPIRSFHDAGLHPVMVNNIDLCGYGVPTPIQAYVIPAVLKGRDIMATAQTGSGKTAAYLIPAISKIVGKVKKLAAPRPNLGNGFDQTKDSVKAEPLILVVAPTRELCCQIFDEARRLCYRSMLRPCVAYGGGPARQQRDELRRGCDILVATPGRLVDFMRDPSLLTFSRLRFTIVDEADEMLHGDWEESMATILSGGSTNIVGQHQYLLLSATFDKNMRKVAKRYLSPDVVRVCIGRAGSVHGNVKQEVVYVDKALKKQALYDLLINTPPARTLVFVRSKKTADFVDDHLFNLGLPSTSIHADRSQMEREDALRAFKSGKAPILVATGVSARGIDVKNVMHVINYDLPSVDYNGKDEYIHRIGRTARIGNPGMATSFYNDDDEPIAPFLCKILLESGQTVPEFLEQFKPEGELIDFEDDSATEEEEDVDADISVTGNGGEDWNSAHSASAIEDLTREFAATTVQGSGVNTWESAHNHADEQVATVAW